MKKAPSKEQSAEIESLADMPDEEIDLSDIPPIEDWRGAVVGRFYRPVKQSVTLRLDADIVDWLKEEGKGYQTRANNWLRLAMERQRKLKGNKPGHTASSRKNEATG